MSKQHRNTGFYWVKLLDRWRVAHYNSDDDYWCITGNVMTFEDYEFEQILESRLPEPEEKEGEA